MHNFWSEDPSLAEDLRRTHAEMSELVVGESTRLSAAARGLLDNTGKLIRPALVLMAARFGTPGIQPVQGVRAHIRSRLRLWLGAASLRDWRGKARRGGRRGSESDADCGSEQQLPARFYRLAAAIELLHIGSLVHDDIIDEAETRRGEPALHVELGSRTAVLFGDLLFASSFETLIRDGGFGTLREAAGAVRNLSRGAISEVEDHRIPSRREYLQRIYGKTAVLFMTAILIGAREAHVPPRIVSILRRVGYNLGMGFQIIDDILDLTGDSAKLGKPMDTDLLEGVYTLPLVYTERFGGEPAEELRTMIAAAARVHGTEAPLFSQKQRDRIRELALGSGGVQAAKADAMRYTERALREIHRLPQVPERECLHRLVMRLLERDY